jgi:hypothetical protein
MGSAIYYSEEVKTNLEAFAAQQQKVVTPDLHQIVENISKTGVSCYPWPALKYLLSSMLNEVLNKIHGKTLEDRKNETDNDKLDRYRVEDESFEERKQKFFQALNSYEEAPFTLQRLCELIVIPEKAYSTNSRKYLTALEKMVNITSTVPVVAPSEIVTTSGGYVSFQPNSNQQHVHSSYTLPTPTPNGEDLPNIENVNNAYGDSMNVDTMGVSTVFPGSIPQTLSINSDPNQPQSQSPNDNGHHEDEEQHNTSESSLPDDKVTPMDM